MKLRPSTLILSVLLLIAVSIIFYLYKQLNSGNEFAKTTPGQRVPPLGECITIRPTSGKYVHVKMMLKASDINIRYFIWDGIDYARRCFKTSDRVTYNFDGYVPDKPGTPIPFDLIVGTLANDNTLEYSIRVFDLRDTLIRKYPANSETGKAIIRNIGYPLVLSNVLDIHQ